MILVILTRSIWKFLNLAWNSNVETKNFSGGISFDKRGVFLIIIVWN